MTKVEEIHAAVDAAADTLLVDMPYDAQRAQALEMIGFERSENVQDYSDHRANHKMAIYYREKYPLYKFITKHQLEKISKKYNLITGEPRRFKGNIPQKNIDEMLAFRIFRQDVDSTGGRDEISVWADELRSQMFRSMGVPERPLNRSNNPRANRLNSYGAPSWSEAFEAKAEQMHRRDDPQFVSLTDLSADNPNICSITADRELFEQPARDLDPIVTVAVKGGFLIVTAWGEEASDPDVVNQNMN